jgi:hypothetical protein
MIAALFLMELNLQVVPGDLVESHIERALPSDENGLGVVVLVVTACFRDFEAEGDLAGEGLVFHENRQEKLFEFISAERFQVKKIDNDPKDLLQVVKFIATYILVLSKKLLDFTGSPPHVLLFLGINEDIVPGGLEDHFRVLD